MSNRTMTNGVRRCEVTDGRKRTELRFRSTAFYRYLWIVHWSGICDLRFGLVCCCWLGRIPAAQWTVTTFQRPVSVQCCWLGLYALESSGLDHIPAAWIITALCVARIIALWSGIRDPPVARALVWIVRWPWTWPTVLTGRVRTILSNLLLSYWLGPTVNTGDNCTWKYKKLIRRWDSERELF